MEVISTTDRATSETFLCDFLKIALRDGLICLMEILCENHFSYVSKRLYQTLHGGFSTPLIQRMMKEIYPICIVKNIKKILKYQMLLNLNYIRKKRICKDFEKFEDDRMNTRDYLITKKINKHFLTNPHKINITLKIPKYYIDIYITIYIVGKIYHTNGYYIKYKYSMEHYRVIDVIVNGIHEYKNKINKFFNELKDGILILYFNNTKKEINIRELLRYRFRYKSDYSKKTDMRYFYTRNEYISTHIDIQKDTKFEDTTYSTYCYYTNSSDSSDFEDT